MKTAARPCSFPRCAAIVRGRDNYCAQHRAAGVRPDRRGSSTDRGYDGNWRKLRMLRLAKTPVCAHCEDALATEVDHIIPIADGGAVLDIENTQALCRRCHERKTRDENKQRRAALGGAVVCIFGPPGAGKTTLVRNEFARMPIGDRGRTLVVDFDGIANALTLGNGRDRSEAVFAATKAARAAVLRTLETTGGFYRAYVLSWRAPANFREPLVRRLRAVSLVLPVSPSECLRRLRDRERDRIGVERPALLSERVAQWRGPVEQWHHTFSPLPDDIVCADVLPADATVSDAIRAGRRRVA